MKWEEFRLPPPSLPSPADAPPAASTCRWLGPIQVSGPCSCQLDAARCRMPFWDVVGIHQVQLLPGLIYSA